MKTNEALLHYLWQFKLFSKQKLKTTDGEVLDIIDVGIPNGDSGPDFFNAKVKIGDTVWAGNVELHVASSDWYKHGHDKDKAYDGVVLHVVHRADRDVLRLNGEKIPQLELEIPIELERNYSELIKEKRIIFCEDKISQIPSVFMNSWLNSLLVERLERKAAEVESLLTQSENDWNETFYISLSKSFGFGTNSQPFELMAKSLPFNILAKHNDNLFQIEALLFGQAGFLEDEIVDCYYEQLQKEYHFLRHKWALEPIDKSQWKLLRIRPSNFPHIRIAQFAALIHEKPKLFSNILDVADDVKKVRKLFDIEVSSYWQQHYLFAKESKKSKRTLGAQSIDSVIINTIVPFLFSYAKWKGEETDKVLSLLENIPVEDNAIIRKWKILGFVCNNAFESQAILQLNKNYCDLKKCLRCRIGHKILTINS